MIAAGGLRMTRFGHEVPWVLVDGGATGVDSDDRLVFVGRAPRGEGTATDPHNPVAPYWLDTAVIPAAPARTGHRATDETPATGGRHLPWSRFHLEEDQLRVHPPRTGASLRVSQRLVQGAAADAFEYALPVTGLAPRPEHPPRLAVSIVGISDAASSRRLELPDHQLTLTLNGTELPIQSWSGTGLQRLEIPLPRGLLAVGDNRLRMTVPRRYGESGDLLPDAMYLDSISLRYPHSGRFEGAPQRFELGPAERSSREVEFQVAHAPIVALDGDGRLLPSQLHCGNRPEISQPCRLRVEARRDGVVWLAMTDELPGITPVAVHGSDNRAPAEQVDYFMIAPAAFLPSLQPLADFHRRAGLEVALVDVGWIYDQYSFGRRKPQAIRDFLGDAWRQREASPPRFVLLAGDASWLTSPGEGAARSRDIVPAWQHPTTTGPAASDNRFVVLNKPESHHPDMALGRFPVATIEELEAVVAKTLVHLETLSVQSRDSRVLLVDEAGRRSRVLNQRLSAILADRANEVSLFASADSTSESDLMARFQLALGAGFDIVHFHGHGGRTSWQVEGSWEHAGKLANLLLEEQVPQLGNGGGRLPLVLSMSCGTAPFDHPHATSLGETLLTALNGGAVAVVAASARNRPPLAFAESLMREILGGSTVGEAVMLAKQETKLPYVAALYNLLGDPAVTLHRR